MELTLLLTKVIGPVLVLRSLSILIDRKHFTEMVAGLEREVTTVSFSFFPIALLMGGTALAVVHSDTSTPAAVLIRILAWGAIAKASALILFPQLVVAKALLLVRGGFLNVVLVVCFVVGGYFTWFGYMSTGYLPGAHARSCPVFARVARRNPAWMRPLTRRPAPTASTGTATPSAPRVRGSRR